MILAISYFSFVIGFFFYNWMWIFPAIVAGYLSVAISHYILHLHFGHKTYKDTIQNKLLSLSCLFTGIGTPLEYALIHRQHHKYSDKKGDPHSPVLEGFWNVLFLKMNSTKMELNLIRDFIKSEFQRKLNLHFFKIWILIFLSVLIIYPPVALFIIAPMCIHATTSAQLITACCHSNGYAENVPWIAIINPWAWNHGDHHE